MIKVLVAVASRHGATAEIATEIAAEIAATLRRELLDAQVEVHDATKPVDMSGFDAVIVGSAIYLGLWLPAARRLIEHHRQQLATRPVWLFSSGPLGDPARPVDELAEVAALGASISARDHRVFPGRLDPDDLRWTERLAVRAVRAPGGDFRDHDATRSWAAGIAGDLALARTVDP